jgi:hypothetical protein
MAVVEIKLFTIPSMGIPPAITVTDSATGYTKEWVNNHDLDRFHKFANTSGTKVMDFDFGSSVFIENAFIWIKNYASMAGLQLSLYNSTNGSSWTGGGAFSGTYTGRSGHMSDYIGVTKRYFRLQLDAFPTVPVVPEIAMVAFCLQRGIINPGELPNSDGKMYRNRVAETTNGRNLSTLINSRAQRIIERKFTFISPTDKDELVAAHDDSNGTLRPLIFMENTSQGADDGEPIVCRFADDSFQPVQSAFEYYECQFRLIEVPSIPTGATI